MCTAIMTVHTDCLYSSSLNLILSTGPGDKFTRYVSSSSASTLGSVLFASVETRQAALKSLEAHFDSSCGHVVRTIIFLMSGLQARHRQPLSECRICISPHFGWVRLWWRFGTPVFTLRTVTTVLIVKIV